MRAGQLTLYSILGSIIGMSKIAAINRVAALLTDEQQDSVLAFIEKMRGVTATEIAGFSDVAVNPSYVADHSDMDGLPRPLTKTELGLIAQSRDDFRLGRTRNLAESKIHVDAELARRRKQRGPT